MNSLELVNEIINDMDSLDIDIIEIDREELNKIKQDLEVLNIIYNKNVSLSRIKFFIGYEYLVILKKYNDMVFTKSDELKLEELNKIIKFILSKKVGDSND